jgi:glycosyltransferase involved in cell wall biosynthesis
LGAMERLGKQLAESEADRAARLGAMERLGKQLAESEADRAARLGAMERLGKQLAESEADRAAGSDENKRLAKMLGELETEGAINREHIKRLMGSLVEADTNIVANMKRLETQNEALKALHIDVDILKKRLEFSEANFHIAGDLLLAMRGSRAFRLLRHLGRWGYFDHTITTLALDAAATPATREPARNMDGRPGNLRLRRVVVDLTPLLPGAENGGAKLIALELVRNLAGLTPDCQWILVARYPNLPELLSLVRENVQIQPFEESAAPTGTSQMAGKILGRMKRKLVRMLKVQSLQPVVELIKTVYKRHTARVKVDETADLIFCPFTAPFLFNPNIPLVSIVYDLQFIYYPQFFSESARIERCRNFTDACRLATRIVSISNHVTETILSNSSISREKVRTLLPQLSRRLSSISAPERDIEIPKLGLAADTYLLYPGNFWRHKNHNMLLTAYNIYLSSCHDSNMKLVCTGAPGESLDALKDVTHRMGISDRVVFPGFIPEKVFTALLVHCRALIYPSLFEGFGMPVFEALAYGKPVLCSELPSLKEIAADAAIYFDPRKPKAIAEAISTLMSDDGLRRDLAERGVRQAGKFGDTRKMAEMYLSIFQDAIASPILINALHGIYGDGWTGRNVEVILSESAEPRHLELELFLPVHSPLPAVSITIRDRDKARMLGRVMRGEACKFATPVGKRSGVVSLEIFPTFCPKQIGMNEDERELGCLCRSCRVFSRTDSVDLLEGARK